MTRKKLTILLIIIAAVMVCAFGGYSIYDANRRFAEGTTVNGIDVSGMKVKDAREHIDSLVADYKMTLVMGDASIELTSKDLGLTSNADKLLEGFMNAQTKNHSKVAFTSDVLVSAGFDGFDTKVAADYPLKESLGSDAISAENSDTDTDSGSRAASDSAAASGNVTHVEAASSNASSLDAASSSDSPASDSSDASSADPLDPVDATAAYNQETQQYEIVADQPGAYLVPSEMEETLLGDIQTLPASVELNPDDYRLTAAVTVDSEDLKKACDNLNSLLDEKITLTFTPKEGSTSTEEVSRDTIGSVLYLDNDLKPQVNEETLGTYASSLANKHNLSGKSVPFTTSSGSVITINLKSNIKEVDTQTLCSDLKEGILGGKAVTYDVPYINASDDGSSSLWNHSYVEIDLTNQHLWCYKNGSQVVSADIVSGTVATGHATPTGVFSIFAKDTDRYLRGTNDDGSKYESYVHFFMPFIGGVGMHDASWRSSFGGNIYLNHGSHGCINMRYADVKKVFDNVSVGTHVIVYGGQTQSEAQKAAQEQKKADNSAAQSAREKIAQISSAGSVDDMNARYNEAVRLASAISDSSLKQTVTDEANAALATRQQQFNDFFAALQAQQAQAQAEAQAAQAQAEAETQAAQAAAQAQQAQQQAADPNAAAQQ